MNFTFQKILLQDFEIRNSKFIIRNSLFLISLFFNSVCFSQQDTAIVRTYGGAYYEEGRQIIECAAGGYAIIGTTGSDLQNNTNFYLLRIDEELNCMWSKSLGGIEVEWGYSLVEDAEGNLLLCGYTNSFGAGAYDALVYKVDALGEIIWQHTYGGTDWDFAYKIIAHPDGGYLVCGKTYSLGNGGSDGNLLHIDNDGNIITEWTYGGVGDDEFVDVEVNENVILVAGNEIIDGVSRMVLYQIEYSGVAVNIIQPSNHINTHVHGLVLDSAFAFLFGYFINEDMIKQFLIEKINIDNSVISEIEEAVNGNYEINDMLVNDYLITIGDGDEFGFGGVELFLQQRDFDGNWIVGPTFGGINDEHGFHIIESSNHNLLIIGSSQLENFNTQLYLIKWPDNQLFQEYSISSAEMNCNLQTGLVNEELTNYELIQLAGNAVIRWNDFNVHNIKLFDIEGRLIMDKNASESCNLNNFTIASGIYVLIIDGHVLNCSKIVISE